MTRIRRALYGVRGAHPAGDRSGQTFLSVLLTQRTDAEALAVKPKSVVGATSGAPAPPGNALSQHVSTLSRAPCVYATFFV